VPGPERTPIEERPCDHNPNIEQNAENCEGNDDPCDGSVDRPHVPRPSTGEKEKGDLEYDAVALALPIMFDNRSTSVSELLVHCLPSIATHATNNDMRRLVYRRSDIVTTSAGVHSTPGELGVFAWSDRLVEAEEGRSEICLGAFGGTHSVRAWTGCR